jgi:hypothetical protein
MDYLEYNQLPPDGPIACLRQHSYDGTWMYRWWDSADSWLIGEPPQRDKVFHELGGCMAALLADCARTGTPVDQSIVNYSPLH